MQHLIDAIIQFRDERDWAQFHNPKDLAISLSLEASELLENFQWKNQEEIAALASDDAFRKKIQEELGDVLIYALLTAHSFGFDPETLVTDKLAVNAQRYPVEEARGHATKYTQLQNRRLRKS